MSSPGPDVGSAWSDTAQPAVLNHMCRPARGGSCRYTSWSAGCVRASPSRRVGEAADLAVAQPIEDEGEESAGGGDLGDVLAAPLRDPPVGDLEVTAGVVLRCRLDRR